MEIISELKNEFLNFAAENGTPLIEEGVSLIEDAVRSLIEEGQNKIEKAKQEFVPLFEDFIKNISGDIKGFAFGTEVESLTLQQIIDFSKKHIVANSNEVVVIKSKHDDGFYLYASFSKDKQLMPVSKNKYLIFKANSLSPDVESLFDESDVVILK